MSRNFLSWWLPGTLLYFTAYSVANEAIINGNKAGVDQFPYQVSIQDEHNRPFCGGGIINETFILTAAHCVVKADNSFEDKRMFILAGTNDLLKTDKPAVIVEIQKISIPTEYNRRSHAADIAVVKLKRPLELSEHIKILQLPSHRNESYIGKTAKIAGFGWHWVQVKDGHPNGDRNDTQLRFAKAYILPLIQLGQERRRVPKNILHAKVKQTDRSKPTGVCLGDSGSVLVYEDTAIGVLSNTPYMCAEVRTGGVYTSVAYYLNFVKNALQDKHHNGIRTHVLNHALH